MNYLSAKEIAAKWNITTRSVTRLAVSGKIPGAKLLGSSWMIPADAMRPNDGRSRLSEKAAPESFKFPFFTVKEAYEEINLTDKDEMKLFRAQDAMCKGDFTDAKKYLSEMDYSELPYYLKAGYLYTVCVIGRNIGDFSGALYAKKEFKSLMDAHPDHSFDLAPLYSDLAAFFQETEDNPVLFAGRNYHPAALAYLKCSNIYRCYPLFLNGQNNSLLSIFEAISMECDQNGNHLLSESAHLYLAFIYKLLGNKTVFEYHCKKVVEVYRMSGYLLLCTGFVGLLGEEFTEILEKEAPELRKKLDELENKLKLSSDTALGVITDLVFRLSHTETKIALEVSKGLTNQEIADRLNLSPSYVGNTLSEIYGKLGISSRLQLKKLVNEGMLFKT